MLIVSFVSACMYLLLMKYIYNDDDDLCKSGVNWWCTCYGLILFMCNARYFCTLLEACSCFDVILFQM